MRKQRPLLRGLLAGAAALLVLGSVTAGYLVWRLATGPLALDIVTPWLTSAIEERFGGRNSVEVGGTQLERDESGRTALRLRDIVVRDPEGAIVASAPKAEVGISAASLLTGQLQAVRLSLIGAAMAVRVEQDGQVTIFAGADKRPIASAPAVTGSVSPATEPPTPGLKPTTPQSGSDAFAALLAWLEGLDVLGLDGRDLSEIGLKSGSLVVDDRRNGKQWKFDNINLTLTRPKEGGVALAVSSGGTDGPWSLTATVSPRGEGRRAIEAVFRDISPRDILLALRMGEDVLDADMPLSAIVRAEIGADGAVSTAEGRIIAGAGFVAEARDADNRMLVDEAHLDWRWDGANRVFTMPFEVQSGQNRLTLLAQVEPPRETGGAWAFAVLRGMLVLASTERIREGALALDRIQIRGRVDPAKRRIEIEQGEVAGVMAGAAFSGALDYSGKDPRLSFGLAGTRMSVSAFKRLWPFFVAPQVRNWVIDHVTAGNVDRVVVATNAPISTLRQGGPPVPDDGLSVEIVANATIRPIDTLPAIRDGDLIARIVGRNAKVTLGRGTVELPSGRKLSVSNGVFEIPDTAPKPPPARLRMRVDGPVDAGAELIAMEPLRSTAGFALDPATTRGTLTGQVAIDWPLTHDLPKAALAYQVDADIANFAGERVFRGMKAEAGTLRVSARPQGVQIKGDMRIGGTPAAVEYKSRPESDAEIRIQATLDDSARSRIGFDMGDTLTGPVAVKMNGRIGLAGGESRFGIDADLTQAKIVDLLPGWNKPAGKPVRASFTLVEKPQSRRLEDLSAEGSGARLKGSVELGADGEVTAANFTTFALSDGDKATLKAERAFDGTLKVALRGDVYDGRGFIKTALAGPGQVAGRRSIYDLDLDVKVGAVAGFNGEALRGLELRLARRAGEIRSFSLAAKLGRESPLLGDLRGRGGRSILFLETADAGALLRFSDMYPRVGGGHMWVEMDPPAADHRPADGVVNIRDFVIIGEPALDRMAATPPPGDGGPRFVPNRNQGVQFARMRVEFTRSPGKLSFREGVVSGPAIGATVEGQIDFLREDVRLRGTLVPAYALNNIPAQLPILGLFLGGGRNEGLLGVTYEVVGPPNGMILRVNPMSAVAPGFLRKLFEFRSSDDQAWTAPGATR